MTAALKAAGPVGLVAEVDPAANAAGAGLSLRPTRVVLFGNPALGTPLMQAGQTVGIDLPLKMLVCQGADGGTRVAYNDLGFLAERHGLGTVAELGTIRNALAGLAAQATSVDDRAGVGPPPW